MGFFNNLGPRAPGKRQVVILHAGEWKTWRHTGDLLPDVHVRAFDLRRLSGWDGMSPWLPRPRRGVQRSQRAAVPTRQAMHSSKFRAARALLSAMTTDDRQTLFLWTDQERLSPAEAAASTTPWWTADLRPSRSTRTR